MPVPWYTWYLCNRSTEEVNSSSTRRLRSPEAEILTSGKPTAKEVHSMFTRTKWESIKPTESKQPKPASIILWIWAHRLSRAIWILRWLKNITFETMEANFKATYKSELDERSGECSSNQESIEPKYEQDTRAGRRAPSSGRRPFIHCRDGTIIQFAKWVRGHLWRGWWIGEARLCLFAHLIW